MSIAFESDRLSGAQLFRRGIAFLVIAAFAVAMLIAKSEGIFQKTVRVTATLVNVGDGLPRKSDVKYQGIVVGLVDTVTPSTDGGPNQVHIDMLPRYASGIPNTVTARVVPSNVFAVPSIQLVYNGPAAPLASGARIPEDQSLATVRLQTSLTALSRIVAAAGRSGTDPTLGILTTVERAVSGRGADALRAGAQLERIVQALNAAMAPDGSASTLAALSDALAGLRSSAPELLGAVHDAIVPMRAIAEQQAQLASLLTGGLTTTGTLAAALANNTDTLLDITGKMGPTLGVLADGGQNFVQMTRSLSVVSTKFAQVFNPETQNLTAKVIVEFTPHRQYTRADCPRYGNLAGPSCATAPVGGGPLIGPDAAKTEAPTLIGGNVGRAGSAAELEQLAAILGGHPNAAADLLLGPLLRGNDVNVTPAPAEGPR